MKLCGLGALACAGALLISGCNQSYQTRHEGDSRVQLVRQWQTESQYLPSQQRASYMADRVSSLLPNQRLNTCRLPRR